MEVVWTLAKTIALPVGPLLASNPPALQYGMLWRNIYVQRKVYAWTRLTSPRLKACSRIQAWQTINKDYNYVS